jgi:hypothetical protein
MFINLHVDNHVYLHGNDIIKYLSKYILHILLSHIFNNILIDLKIVIFSECGKYFIYEFY